MKRTFIILIGLLFSLQSFSQKVTEAYVDSLVAHSMDLMTQAGVAVAVIEDGKLVLSKGYGIQSVSSKKKVNADTRFMIASNTKAFTTTALGMLVDQGKISWKDKVVDVIPEFKMYDPYVTANFMIEDLVTHRSGLGLGAGDLMFIPDGSDFTIDDVITSFQHQEPTSPFRTKYDYDNLLYMVAGEVIHRVSGVAWDDYVQDSIMAPLGMNNSAALVQNLSSDKNIAQPHKVDGNELIELPTYKKPDGGIGAAGGIYSSVNDLSKWVMMHLNEGIYDGDKRLVSKSTHDYLWTAHTNISYSAKPSEPYRNHYRAYGLGFFLFDNNGYTIVQHSGGMPGMLSMVTMIPEKNAAVIILTNSAPGGYSFVSLTRQIKDKLIGVDGIDWIGRIHYFLEQNQSHADSVVNAVWEQVNSNANKKIEISAYEGVYRDDWFGDVVVELKGKELWMRSVRSPKLTGKMYYYGANTFAVKWNYSDMDCDAFAIFSLDENGLAQGLKMKGISPDIDFSFDFHDLDLYRVVD